MLKSPGVLPRKLNELPLGGQKTGLPPRTPSAATSRMERNFWLASQGWERSQVPLATRICDVFIFAESGITSTTG